MKKLLTIFMFSILLTAACNQESTSGGSYATIVIMNDIEYSAATNQLDSYKIGKVIGTISKKVKPNIYPENNQSNFFEEGTVIYSVKNEAEFIIAENTDGELYLLKKAPEMN